MTVEQGGGPARGHVRWVPCGLCIAAAVVLVGVAIRAATTYLEMGDSTCGYLLSGNWVDIRGCPAAMRPRLAATAGLLVGAIVLAIVAVQLGRRARK